MADVEEAWSTHKLRAALRVKYSPPDYAFFEEVTDGTGLNISGALDALAMSLWPSRGLELMGFEIKASRSDWLRELKNPSKAEKFARYCDGFYLVVGDKNIVKEGELPSNWGLLVPRGGKLIVTKNAAKLEPLSVDRKFLAAILRRACAASVDQAALKGAVDHAVAEALRTERREQQKVQERLKQRDHSDFQALQRSVARFEESSGVKIDNWNGEKIGNAVKMVLRGEHKSIEQEMGYLRQRLKFLYNQLEAYFAEES